MTTVIRSQINTLSETYLSNYAAMQKLVAELEEKYRLSLFQGRDKHLEKARSEGKFTARERIELLLDRDAPFMELLPLAGLSSKAAGGTTVGGIGVVSGKLATPIE